VIDLTHQVWAGRGSPNKMTASMFHGGRCWVSDPDHPNFVAGSK
jgi:nonspecific dipeptidase